MTISDHIGPSLVISIHLWQSPTTRAWSNKLIQISNFLVNQSINQSITRSRYRGAFAPKKHTKFRPKLSRSCRHKSCGDVVMNQWPIEFYFPWQSLTTTDSDLICLRIHSNWQEEAGCTGWKVRGCQENEDVGLPLSRFSFLYMYSLNLFCRAIYKKFTLH